nr:hypothetical protein [Pseudomonas sp.]
MAFVAFLLGSILFLPNYAIALEERLQSEKIFKPLQIVTNIKESTKSSKTLSIAGLVLCVIGLAIFLVTNKATEISYDDKIKILVAFILMFNALAYGYLREKSCQNPKQEPSTTLVLISSKSVWRYSLLSAAKDIGFIFLFLSMAVLVKNITY